MQLAHHGLITGANLCPNPRDPRIVADALKAMAVTELGAAYPTGQISKKRAADLIKEQRFGSTWLGFKEFYEVKIGTA